MDQTKDATVLASEIAKVTKILFDFSVKLDNSTSLISACKERLSKLEIQYSDILTPKFEGISNSIPSIQDKVSELSMNLGRISYQVVQCLEQVNKVDAKQDEIATKLDATREMFVEIKQIHTALKSLEDHHDEDIISLGNKFDQLEKELKATSARVDNIYLTKTIIFAVGSIAAAVVAFMLLVLEKVNIGLK